MEAEIKTLKIGDWITLKNSRIGSYISAEGILSDDLYATETGDNIFAVHLMRQYSASRELEDFLQQQRENPDLMNDISSQKYKAALQRGKDNENKLNESYMEQRLCSPVVFGDVIQLMHVKSGKFLTVIADELAKVERENLRVILSSDGSSNSWLQLMPRYKIDREGDDIKSGAELLLKVAERTNEFIHCAEQDPNPGALRELNCSLEISSYSLTIFQSSSDATDSTILLCSDIVTISDPENQVNLTLPIKVDENDEDEDEDAGEKEVTTSEMDEAIRGAHEHTATIATPQSEGAIDTNSLWIIENQTSTVGGPIDFRSAKIRFKHLNSGVYLALGESDGTPLMHFTDEPDDDSTLFSMFQLYNTGSYLINNKPLQLKMGQSGAWIKRGEVHEDFDGDTWTTTSDQVSALSLLVTRYDPHATLAFGTDIPAGEPLDVDVCQAALYYFKRYESMIIIPDGDYINTVWPGTQKSDIDFYKFVCKKLVKFIQGAPMSSDIDSVIDLSNDNMRVSRQSIFRQQGFVQILLLFVNDLVYMSKMAEEVSSDSKKKKKPSSNMQGLLKMSSILLENALTLLYELIKSHPVNQMYVADFMPVLLSHLNSQPLAGKCVTEMLVIIWNYKKPKLVLEKFVSLLIN